MIGKLVPVVIPCFGIRLSGNLREIKIPKIGLKIKIGRQIDCRKCSEILMTKENDMVLISVPRRDL